MLKLLEKPSNGNGKKQPKPEQLQFEVVTVTPDIAKAWLSKNVKNRPKKATHKASFVRDMKAGSWRLTGDPIQFDINTNLINGQHRLEACVEADCNFQTLVVYGLDPTDQDVIDSGASRSARDALALNGHHGSGILFGVVRTLVAIKAGVLPKSTKLSHSEVLRFVADRPTLTKSVGRVWSMPPRIPRAPIGAVHWIAVNKLKAPEVADQFVDVFKTGEPAYKGCPAHRLRERLLTAGGTNRNMIPRSDHVNSVIHAWNTFAANERLDQFRVPKEAHIVGLKLSQL